MGLGRLELLAGALFLSPKWLESQNKGANHPEADDGRGPENCPGGRQHRRPGIGGHVAGDPATLVDGAALNSDRLLGWVGVPETAGTSG